MAEIGLQLRSERERRRLPRADVSRAIGVYIHHIAALEHGDWDHLPEDAVVAGFVRSYAEYLGFDPEAAAADFALQRGIELPPPPEPAVDESAPAPAEQPAPPTPAEPIESPADEAGDVAPAEPPSPEEDQEEVASQLPSAPAEPRPLEADPARASEITAGPRGGKFPLLPVIAAGALILIIALWLGLRGDGDPGETATSSPEPRPSPAVTAKTEAPDQQPSPEKTEAATPAPAAPDPTADRSVDAQPDDLPSTRPAVDGVAQLTVTEYGVGTGVRNHQLVGESDRFKAGTKIWFWTRVQGGSAGHTFRHVWLHEGRVIDATTLRIGSPNWRTQSAKTLYSEGSWAVEARDGAGRVLARSELTSVR